MASSNSNKFNNCDAFSSFMFASNRSAVFPKNFYCGKAPFLYVDSEDVEYTNDHIIAKYVYENVLVEEHEIEGVESQQEGIGFNDTTNDDFSQCYDEKDEDSSCSSDEEEEISNKLSKKCEDAHPVQNAIKRDTTGSSEEKEKGSNIVNKKNENFIIPNSHKSKVYVAKKCCTKYVIKTERNVPKVGVLIVGLGGNNGSTLLGGILANKYNLTYETKEGVCTPNYYGSICMSSTVKLGTRAERKSLKKKEDSSQHRGNQEHDSSDAQVVNVPLYSLLPMLRPEDLVIGGWDISKMRMGDAMKRARVFDVQLQAKLYSHMQRYKPLKSVHYPSYVAENQGDRVDNIIKGDSHSSMLKTLRKQIRKFKKKNNLKNVIVLWSAATERYVNVVEGVNDTAQNLLHTIENTNHSEISPSILYAVAAILENCSYINGSPQNTLIDSVIELANLHNVFVAGNDFKSGQTKLKSVLVDFLISAGIKPRSIVSYNHLGNNDGYNLSSAMQFRSKEISKSNVVDDMVNSNSILYNEKEKEKPDHTIVIKYVPFVGDSKRAMDEYISEIFMCGRNTLVIHNTCEDSLLAAPLILDLIILTELCQRISIGKMCCAEGNGTSMEDAEGDVAKHKALNFAKLNNVLSLLSYLFKSPVVPKNAPICNSLYSQRECIINFIRACVALPPVNHLELEHKIGSCGAYN